jgi:hypothetical protein
MAIDKKHIGRTYGPTVYEIGAEKLREFSYAVGGGIPSMGFSGKGAPEGLDPKLWQGKDIVGFPTFSNVFAIAPFGQAVSDPALGINLLYLVHGEQEYEWFETIRPGDVITSTGVITDIYEKANMDFVTVTTESKNAAGKLVVRGKWTAVIKRQ